MSRLTAVSLLAAASCGTASSPSMVEREFAQFLQAYNKIYDSAEELQERFEIFKRNRLYQEEENGKQNTYVLGINEFSDMSQAEFRSTHLGFSAPPRNGSRLWAGLPLLGEYQAHDDELLESEVDWVAKGAVTPAKSQGDCGSCWSFSTTGALEGAWFVATKTLKSISEQQFIDCNRVNHGCLGGAMEFAFRFAQDKALCSEQSYPYREKIHRCSPGGCEVAIPSGGVTGYRPVHASETALMSALNRQPVSIAIESAPAVFQFYSHGVAQQTCGSQLDHGVLAVGYGADAGVKYWKVKNSWGARWGEDGFIRLVRGKGGKGQCGILSAASFPEVDGSVPPSPSPNPSPSPSPSPCKDAAFCKRFQTQNPSAEWCRGIAGACRKLCGCCDANPPDYCADLDSPVTV